MAAYTTIDNPELYFQTVLYSGNNTSQSITLDGDEDMQPDMVWIKERNGTEDHCIFDAVRGGSKRISPNTTGTEWDSATNVTSFDSDGFSVGSNDQINDSGNTQVAYCWKESNSDAGMDIVTWTGNGSSQNISHSLSAVPHFMITKNRSATGDWTTYHKYGGGTKTFYLSNTDAIGTTSSPWNDTTPTSSVFSVGGGAYTNGDGNSIIGYLWTEKQGFSKFGYYTGNGNADGPMIWLGFRPAWLLIKRSSASGTDWILHDNKRAGFNVNDDYLAPNTNAAEVTGNTYQNLDLLSNGFKLRGSGTGTNTDGATYIYMAFAEAPLVNSEGVPGNAR